MLFCIRLPNFVQIGAHTAEIWRHMHFSRWRPRTLNNFPVWYLLMSLPSECQSLSANQISSTYLNWRLRYKYFRFQKKTSAILKFYFRFRYRPFGRNQISAYYSASGYRISSKSEHTLRKYDVISIFKMAAATAKYYFRFHICWCHCLQNVKVYQQTKFRRESAAEI